MVSISIELHTEGLRLKDLEQSLRVTAGSIQQLPTEAEALISLQGMQDENEYENDQWYQNHIYFHSYAKKIK